MVDTSVFVDGAEIDPVAVAVDESVHRLVENVEILEYVNPVNLEQEKADFFAAHYSRNPVFQYKDHALNAYAFKEQLYRLPIDEIQDADIQFLYREVVDSYADKAEQLSSIGSQQFLYNCLRYYGEPGSKDIANAQFILHAPGIDVTPAIADSRWDADASDRLYAASEVKIAFNQALSHYGFQCPVEIAANMVASAMVSKGRMLINSDIRVNRLQLEALIHHELGVHMVTTMNAREQPLKLLRNGLPLNTLTQEGLAILSEYFSGNLDVERLRILALRVVAVKMLVQGNDFRRTFLTLLEDYGLERERAFKLTARVYRGGGFTKDCLYLRGFRDALKFYQQGGNLNNLLVGKATFKTSDIMNRLILRGIVKPPRYLTSAFQYPQLHNPELNYLIAAIK